MDPFLDTLRPADEEFQGHIPASTYRPAGRVGWWCKGTSMMIKEESDYGVSLSPIPTVSPFDVTVLKFLVQRKWASIRQ